MALSKIIFYLLQDIVTYSKNKGSKYMETHRFRGSQAPNPRRYRELGKITSCRNRCVLQRRISFRLLTQFT